MFASLPKLYLKFEYSLVIHVRIQTTPKLMRIKLFYSKIAVSPKDGKAGFKVLLRTVYLYRISHELTVKINFY